ncbi:MAG: pilus assembly protein PilM [Planctomycetota bacterium]|nr:pilus assembly protein PilM [Planctomycetota bacterium]
MPIKKLLKIRARPIGIDLGSAVVKIAQMRNTDDQLELLAAARVNVPPDCLNDVKKRRDFLAGRLRKILKDRGFKGRQCILSIPAADTFVTHIRTAPAPPDELEKALRWQLEGKLPFNHNDAIIRHMVVGPVQGENEGRQEVIVVAISRQSAEAYLEMAYSSRLEVAAMNVESCAIVQCFARLFRHAEDAHRATLFLDLGQTYTQVVISQGPKLVFARNLLFGADQIDKVVSDVLSISVEEARSYRRRVSDLTDEAVTDTDRLDEAVNESLKSAVAEITKCLRYYESMFPSNPVERAIFLGGQARDTHLCKGIARHLHLPSQVGDPLVKIKKAEGAGITPEDGPDFRKAQPEWVVAVGLSLGVKKEAYAA